MTNYSKEWLTPQEWDILISSDMGEQDRLKLYLLYGCALRVSEMCSLKAEDIDLAQELLIIRKSKNQPDPRAVPISSRVIIGLLDEHIRQMGLVRGDYLFPGRHMRNCISRKAVYERCKRLAREAGIEKPITTHTFRRSRITHLIDAGMPIEQVQFLAGHKGINTTSRYYKYSVTALRKVMTKFDPMARE